ncbi:MAG: lipid-A-disaccharide synthase [Gammaproteobacteria bacterium]
MPSAASSAERPAIEAGIDSLNLGMVAGELSGDLLGAGLLTAIQSRGIQLDAAGIGGPSMVANGFSTQVPMERLSVMGLVEVLKHLPELLRIRRQVFESILASKPDAFIGIDAPDFNLNLETRLRSAGVRTVHYVSPTVWAWREKRIHKISQAADLVLALFPFEVDVYRRHGVPVEFVGHPLADRLAGAGDDRAAVRERLGLNLEAKVLAVLPGSRGSELDVLARPFAKTIANLLSEDPSLVVLAPMATPRLEQRFKAALAEFSCEDRVKLLDRQSHEAMVAADAVLLASGTAALEAMLIGRPMVVAYGFKRLTWWMLRRTALRHMPAYSLPNVLADEVLVPELIQDDCTAENISRELSNALAMAGQWPEFIDRFKVISELLRRDANERAADAVLNLIRGGPA